ncbi:MAG: hypothetical protein IKY85_05885 [Bacteroidaceae bacterium]|nr:hypothetical protein [Bacteroidaceae bacterium]
MDFNDYKKHSSFTTPDGYFEKLNWEIKEATCKHVATESRRRRLTPKYVSIMSYVATIAIIAVVATGIFLNTSNDSDSMFSMSDESDFIENMLTDYPIDEYTFYCYLTGNE